MQEGMYNLGEYYYEGKEYTLYYSVVHTDKLDASKPYLVAETEDERQEGLPSWQNVEMYPSRPLSEAYKRASAQGYRLYNLYKTQEVADILYAQGKMSRPRAQNVRNWIEREDVKALFMSGDYYLKESDLQRIIADYDEKASKRAAKLALLEYKKTHITTNQLAKELGVSRETIGNYRKKGKITAERVGGLYYVVREQAYKEIREIQGWSVEGAHS